MLWSFNPILYQLIVSSTDLNDHKNSNVVGNYKGVNENPDKEKLLINTFAKYKHNKKGYGVLNETAIITVVVTIYHLHTSTQKAVTVH